MTDTDSEQEGSEDVTTEMMFIAEKVQAFPEILEKSQVPAMKKKKTAALTEIVKEYVNLFGKEMEIKALMKKVNNMKTRFRNKTNKNKTGNKPIRLLSWEKVMLKTMDADINPVLSRVSGALEFGVPTQPSLPTLRGDMTTSDAHEMTVPGVVAKKRRSYISVKEVAPSVAPKKLPLKHKFVSEETRQLTTTQLQRLVLVEQPKVARLQQQYYSAKLQKLDENSNKGPSKGYAIVADKTYCNL